MSRSPAAPFGLWQRKRFLDALDRLEGAMSRATGLYKVPNDEDADGSISDQQNGEDRLLASLGDGYEGCRDIGDRNLPELTTIAGRALIDTLKSRQQVFAVIRVHQRPI